MNPLLTLAFGFFLGLKHAFEADHMIAVTTMVTEHKNPVRAALVGTFWGIGHTTTLFIIGMIVLLLNISIPENVSLFFEMIVGVMLVTLGIRTIMQSKNTMHEHEHSHDKTGKSHTHYHYHETKEHIHQHQKSFIIGSIHGIAGSGALMVLVLATIKNITEGVLYILLFGIGSIAGMTLMSFIVGLPFIYSVNKFNTIEQKLKIVAGLLSIIFGGLLIYEIGFIEGLIMNLF